MKCVKYLLIILNLFFISTIFGQTPAENSNQSATRLQIGKPETGQIAGGETRSFAIELPANQFIKLTVAEDNSDVTVKLFAPDEKIAAAGNNTLDGNYIKKIWYITPAAGVYKLQIASTEIPKIKGKFAVMLVDSRPADDKAGQIVNAANLTAEGVALQEQRTAAGFTGAIQKYQEAVKLAQVSGDKSVELMPRVWLGMVLYFLRQPQLAIEQNDTALVIARELKETAVEAQIYDNYARIYNDSDPLKSIEYSTKSLNLQTEAGNRRNATTAINTIGAAYLKLGKLEKAIDFFNQAIEIYRENENPSGIAGIQANLGAVYALLGEHQKAIENYQKALVYFRQTKITFLETNLLSNIGYSYEALGEPQKAIDFLSEALPLARTTGNKQSEAKILANIGIYFARLGDFAAALDYFSTALTVAREIKSSVDILQTLNNLGGLLVRIDEHQKALDSLNEALPLARQLKEPFSESAILYNIGSVKLKTGKPQEALTYYNQSLEIRRSLNNPIQIAYTLSQIGNTYSALGDNTKALENISQALTVIRTINEPRWEANILYCLANIQNNLNRLDEARQSINDSIKLVESIRSRVGNQDLRTLFLADVADYYALRTEILMKSAQEKPNENFTTLGLESAENARARSLLDLLNESRVGIRQNVDSTLLEREITIRRMLSAKANQQSKLFADKNATAEQKTSIQKEIERLTADYETIQTEIRRASPRYAALTQPAPVSLKEIQNQILDRDTILLEYSLGETKSYLWVVGQNSLKSYELPKRAEIEIAARRVYDFLTARNHSTDTKLQPSAAELNKAITDLSRMIIAPAAKELTGKRLLIVADGALQYIPFGVMPAVGTNPLITSNEIVTLPSASTLGILRREQPNRSVAPDSLAIIADPVFEASDERVSAAGKNQNPPSTKPFEIAKIVKRSANESGLINFSRLRFSRDEADNISLIAKKLNPLEIVDFAANKDIVTGDKLNQSKIIHFATHGLINSQNPELSGIVLSLVNEKGEPQDGFLRLFEIYNLSLNADLIVLSACQTALGQEIKGEGLVGLTRGFMYAGTPRLVASLWSVDDRATAELMKRFYQKLLTEKMRPAAALRSAQIEMRQNSRWREPYFWAAFTLQGEWR